MDNLIKVKLKETFGKLEEGDEITIQLIELWDKDNISEHRYLKDGFVPVEYNDEEYYIETELLLEIEARYTGE